jgi:hypothetical protein
VDIETDQWVPTHELVVGIPKWVRMLAILRCVQAGDHDRDYMGACRMHMLEARRLARQQAEEDLDAPR